MKTKVPVKPGFPFTVALARELGWSWKVVADREDFRNWPPPTISSAEECIEEVQRALSSWEHLMNPEETWLLVVRTPDREEAVYEEFLPLEQGTG